ncbi:MAG: GNAT family N-acetyltransferase [Kiritimatiellae bacterium]|nr:GNAT family N-acetyltransferase [Kiritimatiellia bacterium]
MKLIDLKASAHHPVQKWLLTILEHPLEKTLSIKALNDAYDRLAFFSTMAERDNVFQNCLDCVQAHYSISEQDILKIPKQGPLVVVANHPFGGLEGVVLGHIIFRARPDVRVLGNYLLQRLSELREWIIPVDPFGNRSSSIANAKAIKAAIRWVANGGALVTFPAGEVAHFAWGRAKVTDPRWSPHVGAIIKHAQADVLPVFFPGANSLLFQLAGLFHPRLRTILLPHELINKSSKVMNVYIGKTIPWKRLRHFNDNEAITEYLRNCTFFLKNRLRTPRRSLSSIVFSRLAAQKSQTVAPAADSSLLRNEIAVLPPQQLLAQSGGFGVYLARAQQIPQMLGEIGRLREITFREVHEGTGRPTDLDRFDQHYLHLFLWNREKSELVGAYRLGLGDVILHNQGARGLYTTTLFKFKRPLMNPLKDAIEIGRSFIRSEYQKEYSCLALLWRGIGRFVVLHPKYKILFGPVSISQDYHSFSKKLIVQFLRQTKLHPEFARYVKARAPYRALRTERKTVAKLVQDIDDVSLLISEIEKDGKGVPILLKHYLKLNARILSFNVDRRFSNVVDSLILVDMTKTDGKLLSRFMGADGYRIFADYHKLPAGAPPAGLRSQK